MVLLKKTNSQNYYFLGYYSKAKAEECDQYNLCFCDYFQRSIACIKTYCLERNVHISMVVTTKDSFRGKKTLVNYYLSRYYTNTNTERYNQIDLLFSGSECTYFIGSNNPSQPTHYVNPM